jgi:pimeloyl-ACP methyl ester carboxylesterase
MKLQIQSLAIDFQEGDPLKRPFIFLHGNTQNDTCGKGVKAFFQKRGHTVLSYDLPGHGDSKLDTADYVFEDLIELNQQVLKHFDIQKPILCGHSLGGIIHSGTIARYQLADASLILCGSYDGNPVLESLKQDEDLSEIGKMLAEYVEEGRQLFQKQFKYDYFANREVDDEEELRVIHRKTTHPAANEANLNTLGSFSARPVLSKMNIPILVLHGEEETVIPKRLVEEMARAYDQINICWYEGRDHYAFYQEVELTERYLEQHYNFLAADKH